MEHPEPTGTAVPAVAPAPQPTTRRYLGVRVGWSRALVLTAAVLCVTQALAGAWWWIRAWGNVPAYGDTVEYVNESHTLAVDSYRTLAYPLLIRATTHAQSLTGLPWNEWISVLQLVASVLATWYLAVSLVGRGRPWWVAGATVVGVCAPLPLHFTHAVLTDSLASSALLVLTGGLVRVAARDDRGIVGVAGVVAGAVGSVLLRPDRLYICTVVATAAFVVLVVRHRRGRIGRRALLSGVAVVVLGVLVPAAATTWMNKQTQTANLGREQQSLSGAAFDRIAYRHIDAIRSALPPEVAAALPPPQGSLVPAQPAGATLESLRAAGGDAYVHAAISAALRCCAAEVVLESTRDVALDALGPYPVAADWVTGRNGSTQWNFSRMRGTAPGPTDAFMAWSVATTALLLPLSIGAVLAARRRRDTHPWRASALLIAAATVLALSAFFALVTSLDPNSRYTLAIQSLWWVVPVALLADARRATTPSAGAPRGAA